MKITYSTKHHHHHHPHPAGKPTASRAGCQAGLFSFSPSFLEHQVSAAGMVAQVRSGVRDTCSPPAESMWRGWGPHPGEEALCTDTLARGDASGTSPSTTALLRLWVFFLFFFFFYRVHRAPESVRKASREGTIIKSIKHGVVQKRHLSLRASAPSREHPGRPQAAASPGGSAGDAPAAEGARPAEAAAAAAAGGRAHREAPEPGEPPLPPPPRPAGARGPRPRPSTPPAVVMGTRFGHRRPGGAAGRSPRMLTAPLLAAPGAALCRAELLRAPAPAAAAARERSPARPPARKPRRCAEGPAPRREI